MPRRALLLDGAGSYLIIDTNRHINRMTLRSSWIYDKLQKRLNHARFLLEGLSSRVEGHSMLRRYLASTNIRTLTFCHASTLSQAAPKSSSGETSASPASLPSPRHVTLRHRSRARSSDAPFEKSQTHIEPQLLIQEQPHYPSTPSSPLQNTFTMASRSASRALRASAKQLATPAVQRRTFVSALNAARAGVTAAPRAAVTAPFVQKRGVKTVDFAGTKETVYGRFSCARGSVRSNWD